MNGQPLANALVSFQPIAKEGEINAAGQGSTGKTNEKGEYILTFSNGKPGAVVGKHRVLISVLEPQVGDSDARPPRGGFPLANKVPERYGLGEKDELSFVVPAGGTDKADFPLTSP
jgi:hypothetical protein